MLRMSRKGKASHLCPRTCSTGHQSVFTRDSPVECFEIPSGDLILKWFIRDEARSIHSYMGLSKNRGTPKWMVHKGKSCVCDSFGFLSIFSNVA